MQVSSQVCELTQINKVVGDGVFNCLRSLGCKVGGRYSLAAFNN